MNLSLYHKTGNNFNRGVVDEQPTEAPQSTTARELIPYPTAPPNKMLVFDGQSWIAYDFRYGFIYLY